MIKECREYLDFVISSFDKTSKKNKAIALIFTVFLGLLISVCFVCIYINLFMQILGLKSAMIIVICSCGLLLHLILSFISPIYYISLNELNKDVNLEKISYKKIFISLITDWFMISFIIICVTVLVIFVNSMLF